MIAPFDNIQSQLTSSYAKITVQLDGDPSTETTALQRIHLVMKDGHVVV